MSKSAATRVRRNAAAEQLAKAWQLVREGADVTTCYRALVTDRGPGRVHGNGPAFASKYLYFAQAAAQPPRCLILDRVVAGRLRDLDVWPKAPLNAWYPDTYAAYCDLIARWASEASRKRGRDVSADEIEYVLFKGVPS